MIRYGDAAITSTNMVAGASMAYVIQASANRNQVPVNPETSHTSGDLPRSRTP